MLNLSWLKTYYKTPPFVGLLLAFILIIRLQTLLIFLYLHSIPKRNNMKTNILIFCYATLLFTACKKSGTGNNPQTQETYLNTAAGSSWTYHEKNSSGTTPENSDYTVTSTSKDTAINGRSYHVYNYSYSGNEYLNVSGHSYYQFDSIPGGLGQIFERLYLKDDAAVGISWKQDISVTIPGILVSIPVTITNNIAEKGISRTANGINYTNVIHVSTGITSTLIPSASITSSINSYYAQKYGLIENTSVVHLDYLGITENVNIETKLLSAVLK